MLGRFLLALLLTLAIEGCVAWLFGFRRRRSQLAVAMINVITNPVLNLLLLVLAYLGLDVTLWLIFPLEVVVVAAEWGLLVYAFGDPKGRLFVLSLLANAASFLAGILLFWT
jgi:membrane-bound ClpP family serine protease